MPARGVQRLRPRINIVSVVRQEDVQREREREDLSPTWKSGGQAEHNSSLGDYFGECNSGTVDREKVETIVGDCRENVH